MSASVFVYPARFFKRLTWRGGCKIASLKEENHMFKVARKLSFLALIILLIAACNLPSNATPTEDPNAVFTAAALTVQAQLT